MRSLHHELPCGRRLSYGNKVERKRNPDRYEAEAFEISCMSRFGGVHVVGVGRTRHEAMAALQDALEKIGNT